MINSNNNANCQREKAHSNPETNSNEQAQQQQQAADRDNGSKMPPEKKPRGRRPGVSIAKGAREHQQENKSPEYKRKVMVLRSQAIGTRSRGTATTATEEEKEEDEGDEKRVHQPQRQQQEGLVAAGEFSWLEYASVRCGSRALNGHLFQQQHFVERSLAQHIYRPGRPVRIRIDPAHGDGDDKTRKWLSGRVSLVFGASCRAIVEIPASQPGMPPASENATIATDANGIRTEFMSVDALEPEPDAQLDPDPKIEAEFRKMIAEHPELLRRKLFDFIEEGQFFELQDGARNTSTASNDNGNADAQNAAAFVVNVHTVRVAQHHGGLVMAQYENGRRELVHITSERCHPLGWTREQDPEDKYVMQGNWAPQEALKLLREDPRSVVPRWLFTFRPIGKHKFKPGLLLEMLDPYNRLSFVPAYVTECVNSHYFKVRPIRDVRCLDFLLNGFEYIFHRASPGIFPVGWCFKNQIRLTFPKGMNQSETSFSYSALRLKLRDLMQEQQQNATTGVADEQQPAAPALSPTSPAMGMQFSFAADTFFELPKMAQKKLETIRYLEIQDEDDRTLFYPGAVVRSHQHMLWVHCARDEKPYQPAKIFSITSPELFRCGTACDASSALNTLRYFTVPVPIPPALNDRAILTRNFTSNRSALKESQKHFMSDMWLKGDLLLPTVYLNPNCFSGPFLSHDKLRTLCTRYGPAPLPHVINAIMQDLLRCGVRTRELTDLLGADKLASSKALRMNVKLKHANRRVRFVVEVCERPAQFPGWLKMLLIRLDACPNLFSLSSDTRDKCPLSCSTTMASLPYMSQSGHVNTASQSTSQQQTNKLNQAAQQLKKAHQQRLRGKKKGKKVAKRKKVAGVAKQPSATPTARPKRLSIAQPVVDDDEEEEEEQDAVEDAGPSSRRRSSRKSVAQVDEPLDDGEEGNTQQSSASTTATTTSTAPAQSSSPTPSSSSLSSSTSSSTSEDETLSEAKKPREATISGVAPISGTPWTMVWTANDGQMFFHNVLTRLSQWEMPPELWYHPEVMAMMRAGPPARSTTTATEILDLPLPLYSPIKQQQTANKLPTNNIQQQQFSPPTLPYRSQHHFGGICGPPAPPPIPLYAPYAYPPAPYFYPPPYHHHLAEPSGSSQSGPPNFYSSMSSSSSSSNVMVKQYMSNNHPKNRNNYPPVDSNPAGWSCEQVRRWVTAAGFADCAQRLMDEEVDGSSLLLLNQTQFQNLGLKLGPTVKMQQLVEFLRNWSQVFENQISPVTAKKMSTLDSRKDKK